MIPGAITAAMVAAASSQNHNLNSVQYTSENCELFCLVCIVMTIIVFFISILIIIKGNR